MSCMCLQVFEALSGSEQLGLMSSLGSYHVWASLGAPDGLHFRLDLTQPEQRDVAREVVKVCGWIGWCCTQAAGRACNIFTAVCHQ